jgi:hypothetical protein
MLKGVKKELREQVFGKETHPPSRRVDNLFV